MSKEKYNKITTQHILNFIIIFLFAFCIAFSIFFLTVYKKANEDFTKINEDVNRINLIINENMKSDNSDDSAFEIYGEQTDDLLIIQDMMQSQYDSFTATFAIIATILGIMITLISVIYPIYNYQFLNKEVINSFEKRMMILYKDAKSESKDNMEIFLLQQKLSNAISTKNNDLTFTYDIDKAENIAYAESLIGNFYIMANMYNKAKQHFVKAIANDKTIMKYYYNLGLCHMRDGSKDYDTAITYLTEAHDLDDKDYDCNSNLGNCYFKKAKLKPEKAKSYYKKANKYYLDAEQSKNPYLIKAYNNLAMVNIELSKLSEKKSYYLNNAKEYLDIAIEHDSTHAMIYCTYAEFFHQLGAEHVDEKKEKYNKAISLGYICEEGCSICRD